MFEVASSEVAVKWIARDIRSDGRRFLLLARSIQLAHARQRLVLWFPFVLLLPFLSVLWFSCRTQNIWD